MPQIKHLLSNSNSQNANTIDRANMCDLIKENNHISETSDRIKNSFENDKVIYSSRQIRASKSIDYFD